MRNRNSLIISTSKTVSFDSFLYGYIKKRILNITLFLMNVVNKK